MARKLEVREPTANRLVKLIRASLYLTRPETPWQGTVEVDEVYQTCGSQGEKKLPPDSARQRG